MDASWLLMEAGPSMLTLMRKSSRTGHGADQVTLSVFIDPNVPTNGGAGTNQDSVLVFRPEDSTLYEGVVRAEVFREPYAPQLSVYLRVHNYVALATERYATAGVRIIGTGLTPPVFA